MTSLDDLRRIFAIRWPAFTPEEVLSPDGLKLVHNQGVFPLQESALDKLQAFREALGKPIIVNLPGHQLRGWRSAKENYDLNKWQNSFHVSGCAFDASIEGLTPEEVAEKAIQFGFAGIGIYVTWVHIDCRSLINKQIIWKAK